MVRRYCEDLDTIAEFDAYTAAQSERQALELWRTEEQTDEFEPVQTTTPDQTDTIAELEAELRRRIVAA